VRAAAGRKPPLARTWISLLALGTPDGRAQPFFTDEQAAELERQPVDP
jgi:hypothetical protein